VVAFVDSGRVLVALEEQQKWRERRERLRERLRGVQARKRYLQRELDAVRRKVARLETVLSGLSEGRAPSEGAYGAHDRIVR